MRSLILSISLLLGLVLTTMEVKASHLAGAEITYKQIDTKKFRFDFVFYRDCSGVPLSDPSSVTFLKCKNKSSYGVSLTLASIKKIDLANDTFCFASNTSRQGLGFEEHRYYCIIDFDSSPYSALYNCSETLIMETGQCCRPGAISTGPSNTNFYTYAELDLNASKNNNSSPVFSTKPYFFYNGNQSTFVTFNAIDSNDRDSLSYAFSQVKTNYTSNASFNSGYDYDQPLKVYYPGSLKYPYNNPNSSPVIGMYLDELTGDMAFTSIRLDDITSFVIEVTEWRRDSTNKYIKIGSIRREALALIRLNQYNYQPEISQKNRVYNICEGEKICIDFKVKDIALTPPPPAPTPAEDTVTFHWSNSIKGASFTVSHDTTPRESAQFCWTPQKGTKSNLPYTFVVTAKDNNAMYYGVAARTYSIYVSDRPTIKINNKRINCNTYQVNCLLDSTYKGTIESDWEVLDSNYKKITDTAIVSFFKSKKAISSELKDSLRIKVNGKYYIKQSFGKTKLKCPVVLYDSIVLNDLIGYVKLNAKDTSICPNTSILLSAQTDYNDKFTYDWSVSNDTSWHKSDSTIIAGNLNATQFKTYSLEIENQFGCAASSKIKITGFASYPFKFNNTYSACQKDTIEIKVGGTNYRSFVWNNKSGINAYKTTINETIHIQYNDSFKCQFFDTVQAIINPNPVLQINDSTACSQVTIYPGKYFTYSWSNATKDTQLQINKSGKFWLTVSNSAGCKAIDTFQITLYPNPTIYIGADTSICSGPITIQLDTAYKALWSTNETTNKITINQSGIYGVQATDINGCKGTDSILVTIYPKTQTPILSLSNDTLWSSQYGKHFWYKDNSPYATIVSNYLNLIVDGTYNAFLADSNGCESGLSNKIVYKKGSISRTTIPFKIYPNPNSGKLYIELEHRQIQQIKQIYLYDLVGKRISFTSSIINNIVEITNNDIAGSYAIDIELESGESIRQMVVFQK
jgi:hypothetical protein